MLAIDIPGHEPLRFESLVLDYNGTLACDGTLLAGVEPRLNELARQLNVGVVTADTFGRARAGLEGVACELSILPAGNQAEAKRDLVQQLDPGTAVCIGNGRNDRLMLETAALGIAVVLAEGAAVETLNAAQVVCTDINAALDLLLNPLRLVATLRS